MLGHQAGGQRAAGGGALARVVVGLVADVLAEGVVGEGDAEIDQLVEAARAHGGLDERDVAVHGAAGEERFGHAADGVGFAPGEGELVVGLLVRAGVARRSHVHALGDDGDVLLSQRNERVGGVVPGASGAHDNGVEGVDGQVQPGDAHRAAFDLAIGSDGHG